MKWIEKVGTGYKRILDYFKAENLKLPKFETQSGGTLITIFAAFEVGGVTEKEIEKKSKETTTEAVKSREKTTEKTTEKILKLIIDNPKISQDNIAKTIGITADGVFWNIKKLKDKGLLERIGADKGGYWKITAANYTN